MSDTAIQVDNVSKLYQLGTIGADSFKYELYRWWAKNVLKKEDPSQDVDRLFHLDQNQSHIWALKQVSFEVKKGEIWGLVGSNGSGKSTLLKIISRIIRPTHGSIRGNGRLSSLLEIGAGFHDDLSGRENIYLSGYIMGMKRQEIKQRFDEIIEFSGVAQFIDTPVKRYSSGMYVRLAFAVAAHLDSDIMIVDEILAVGDAEFQKKCLDKMQSFARNEGRTILFVSHNVEAVTHLCDHAIWLQRGAVMATGSVQSIIHKYIQQEPINQLQQKWNCLVDAPGNDIIRIKSVEIIPQESFHLPIDVRTPLLIKFTLWIIPDKLHILVGLHLFSLKGEAILNVMSPFTTLKEGVAVGECILPGNLLNDGSYYISIMVYNDNWEQLYYFQKCITFDVEDHREINMNFGGEWIGIIRPKLPVKLVQEE